MAHRELALGMIGNMIAEITRGIRADDVSSRVLRTLCGLRGARRDAPPAQRPRKGQTS